MKIDIQNTIDALNAICSKMGAKSTDWELKPEWDGFDKYRFLGELEKYGEVSGYDLKYIIDNFYNGETFGNNYSTFFVYIRDRQAEYLNRYGYPKFHIHYCKTLQDAMRSDRYAKYVSSTKTDGIFKINIISNNGSTKEENVKLDVCWNCLSGLNYKDFNKLSQKNKIRNDFSIKEFFELYAKTNTAPPPPKYHTDTAPINKYPDNWDVISNNMKRSKNYTCENCGLNLERDRQFLHVHHKNTMKDNNSPDNLEVLCNGCHVKKHPHMKPDEEFKEKYNR